MSITNHSFNQYSDLSGREGYDLLVGDLYRNYQQEHFSLAHVEALAYTAGYAVEHVHVDVYGVDFEMRDRAFRVDVQMKCILETPRPGESISYDLDVRTYDLLTDPYRNVPAFLFVVEVPRNVDNWIKCTSEGIRLFKCGYYADMSTLGETDNRRTQRVRISRDNRLTVESLDKLMREARG